MKSDIKYEIIGMFSAVGLIVLFITLGFLNYQYLGEMISITAISILTGSITLMKYSEYREKHNCRSVKESRD